MYEKQKQKQKEKNELGKGMKEKPTQQKFICQRFPMLWL